MESATSGNRPKQLNEFYIVGFYCDFKVFNYSTPSVPKWPQLVPGTRAYLYGGGGGGGGVFSPRGKLCGIRSGSTADW